MFFSCESPGADKSLSQHFWVKSTKFFSDNSHCRLHHEGFRNTVRNSPHATGNQKRFCFCFSNREAFTQPFHFPSKTHFTVKRVGVPVKNPTSLYSGSFPASPCVTAEPRGLSGEYHGLSCRQGKQPTSDRRLF